MSFSAQIPCALPCGLGGGDFEPVVSDTSLEAALSGFLRNHARIAALVGDRITPGYIDRGSDFPAFDYKVPTVQHFMGTNRSAGYAKATVELNCWSSRFDDVVKLADTLRNVLQGVRRRWWGCCFIFGVVIEDQDDEYQQPADGSEVYWFCRSLDVEIFFREKVPTF